MRKRRKIRYGRVCILLLALALVIAGVYKSVGMILPLVFSGPSENEVTPPAQGNPLPPTPEEETQDVINTDALREKLYSPYAILIRLKDGKTVFEAKSEEKIYPASLTKMMTALVAIENLSDLDEKVLLPEKIFADLYKADASLAGFLPGEKAPAVDLLYGALLPSGAEASIGLALAVSGSESEFVKLMNQKAGQLGMVNTHFTNVCGLYDENHYSTVKDIAVLLQAALKNETFRKVFTAKRHSTESTNLHSGGFTVRSTLFAEMETPEFDGGEILGGKTGYTGQSGLCLASLAEKNGKEYILITAGADGNHKTEQYDILDAITVYGKFLK